MTPRLTLLLLAAGLSHLRPLPQPKAAPDAGASQASLTDDQVRARVRAYLRSIDTPISQAQWQALGPKAVPVLKEVVEDRRELPTRRARAVSGWAALGTAEDAEALAALVQKPDEAYVVRLSAVRGMENLLPAEKLVASLQPVLQTAPDPKVRKAAAEALTRKAPNASCSAVAAQAAREGDAGPGRFATALQRCGR